MSTMSEQFGSNTKDSTARLIEMFDRFSNTFVPIQEGIGEFSQSLSSLNDISVNIQQAGIHINGSAKINNQSMVR